ncbi:MAG: prepilin-type N-terminal cleavage/methylation domain-containing protein [Deltaproteobacteria bacterium]|nr:prepilin-type N-terminal cleavage/methylation domain-containing protein [Deltaproteobacteria bacterium]
MRGFTLLEVLLALTIFTIIAVATTKHIQQIQETKQIAFRDLDFYNGIRAALSVMRFDLSQAFHVLLDDLGEENKTAVIQNQPVPHTLFDGRKNEMVFTSLSHRVYYTGVRECEQTEISYFIQRGERGGAGTLMKRESEWIDSDLFQGGQVYRILDNVESIEFKYWDPKNAKWLDDWNSDGGEFMDRFPLAIKVKITTLGLNRKHFTVESEFKIAFPNNDPLLAQF